jgi:5'-nucleotidase
VKKLLSLSALGILSLAVGCSHKTSTANNDGKANLNPAPPAPSSVTYPGPTDNGAVAIKDHDTAPAGPSAAGQVSTGGGKTYVVRKGDTLWGIAQRTYGDGKQYKKIAAANPAIHGDQVKVGQTITLP